MAQLPKFDGKLLPLEDKGTNTPVSSAIQKFFYGIASKFSKAPEPKLQAYAPAVEKKVEAVNFRSIGNTTTGMAGLTSQEKIRCYPPYLFFQCTLKFLREQLFSF